MFLINPYILSNPKVHTIFDGINEYINFGNDSSLDFEYTDTFSISAWINFDSATNGAFVAKFGTDVQGYIFKVISSKLRVQLLNSAPNQVIADGGTTLSSSTWYHVCFTYDGSGLFSGVNIYLDASAESLTNVSDDLMGGTIQTTQQLNVGVQRNDLSNPFDGKIDKVIIYSKELSGSEVSTIYNFGRVTGLIGIGSEVSQWELDSLNPLDQIGSNDGTSQNMDQTNIVEG